MPTFLREHLVLKLKTGGACAFDQADGARGIDRIAETGVAIDEDRYGDHIGDRPNGIREFTERDETNVRDAEMHVRNSGASDVHAFVAEVLSHAGKQRIGRAGNDRRITPSEDGFESLGTGAHGFQPPARHRNQRLLRPDKSMS